MTKNGLFISLDFEFFWGRDSGYEYSDKEIKRYSKVHDSVRGILSLFEKYNVAATWATVGLAAIDNPEELEFYKPSVVVNDVYRYADNYKRFKQIWDAGDHGSWLNVGNLIEAIKNTPKQEIASHTFAHIFCNELGVTKEVILADVFASKKLFKIKYDLEIESLVFPFNQIPENINDYDIPIKFLRTDNPNELYRNYNIKSFRKPQKRMQRFVDRYININIDKSVEPIIADHFVFIPESRFLPPSISSLFGDLIVNQVKYEMEHAAKCNKTYHLWWHPHNFTHDIPNCLDQLEKILQHFSRLSNKYGMESFSMNQSNEIFS